MGIFDARVVVITGAASGWGRDYARCFSRDGAHVVLTDVADARDAAAEASAAGRRCLAVTTDVTRRASVDALMQTTLATFGRLDVLVNNAGVWRGLAEAGLLHCPEQRWAEAWAVNVTGALHCYQAAVPLMQVNGFGRIVNLSSTAALTGGNAAGLTAHAVEHMTRGMAREVGSKGITVNCVAPEVPAADPVGHERVLARPGTSRDSYQAIAYLCGPAAEWVTGQVLRVDGGAGVG